MEMVRVSGIRKLSGPMQTALVAIAQAMPLAGDLSLALLPVRSGRTVQALEDRELIKASTSNTGTGVRWTLTDAGWQEAARLELAAKGCACPTPPWHNPTCPALPGIRRAEEAAAVAKAAAAETEWTARNLKGRLRCQALKFEGHRCANVITCTVTTGEWMELTEDNIGATLERDDLEIEEIHKGDGSGWIMGLSELAPGDLIFINAVHRAWCGECAEEERKARDFASVLIITPLAEGDYIPTASRYCANGYNDAACDDFCGPDDHKYPGERVQWWSVLAQATVYGTVTGHGLGEFDRPWVTVREDGSGNQLTFWRSQVQPIPARPSQLATYLRAAIGLKF